MEGDNGGAGCGPRDGSRETGVGSWEFFITGDAEDDGED